MIESSASALAAGSYFSSKLNMLTYLLEYISLIPEGTLVFRLGDTYRCADLIYLMPRTMRALFRTIVEPEILAAMNQASI